MANDENKQQLAITVKKEDNISEWYTQVIQKADLIEHTRVSGCMVFKPNSYQIWEKIQEFLNNKIKKSGVKNAYFPLLIPESLLMKEAEHVEGFSPEVAWVTHAGDSELPERLAIRPTSETIMYDSYSKWIQSYRDLPLRLNQWCSVVRWEFKHPTPFMRNREFLWQEGHTVFATKEEADAEVLEILGYYADVYQDLLAMPVEKGLKSVKEKFAGADYSTTVEPLAPDGKVIQGGTSHMLGQNFAKAFDITFLDKNQKRQYPYQNSWGLSTRTIAGMILFHSDNKGLVLPPRVANNKLVIIPLLFKGKEEKVLDEAKKLKDALEEFNPILDDDKKDSPGFKFSKWEMQGIPLRIEIGPRDIEAGQVIVSRRDSEEKIIIKLNEVSKKIPFFKKVEGKEKVRDDELNQKRYMINCIIKHHKEDKYLTLDWKKQGWKSFVIGGIEEGEDYILSALREIKEETGYKNLKFTGIVCDEIHANFYANHKNINRYGITKCLSFELIDDEKSEVSKEEKGLHETIWVDKNKIEEYMNLDQQKYLWRKFIGSNFKYEIGKKYEGSIYDEIEVIDKQLIKNKIQNILEDMHKNLFDTAKKIQDELTIEVDNFKDFEKAIKENKRCLVPWQESAKSEEEIKEKTGAKSSCIPFRFKDKSLVGIKCFYSGKPATCWVYFAKSY